MCYLIIFQRPNILEAWLTRAQQVEKSNHVDASDEQLTLIPEQILNNEARVQILNLRRNSLISRPPTEKVQKVTLPNFTFKRGLSRNQ